MESYQLRDESDAERLHLGAGAGGEHSQYAFGRAVFNEQLNLGVPLLLLNGKHSLFREITMI